MIKVGDHVRAINSSQAPYFESGAEGIVARVDLDGSIGVKFTTGNFLKSSFNPECLWWGGLEDFEKVESFTSVSETEILKNYVSRQLEEGKTEEAAGAIDFFRHLHPELVSEQLVADLEEMKAKAGLINKIEGTC